MHVRPAIREDLGAIEAIYDHYVRTSTCTFQLEPSPAGARQAWFDAHDDAHPILVATASAGSSDVLGWASLSTFNARAAYARTVELSIYLRHDERGRGLGKLLVGELLDRARALGHHVVVSGVSGDQDASLALHRSLGFREVGRFRELGFKFGRWIDVVWFDRFVGCEGPDRTAANVSFAPV